MLRRVFLLIKTIDFMIQIHESFLSLTGTSIHILVSKRWSPTFFDLADSLNVNLKTHARTNFALFDQFTWQIEVCTIEYLLHLWEKSTLGTGLWAYDVCLGALFLVPVSSHSPSPKNLLRENLSLGYQYPAIDPYDDSSA